DFGIARAISDASSTMTQTAAVVGTAQYLSPEQARGETVDSRSDVYSTGCLLYELLTGRPPFVGDSPVAVAYQHVREQPTPPSAHDEDLTPEIDAIVMKALAKRVEDRYQSAAAMKADIDRYLAGLPVQATPPPAPVEDATSVLPAGAVPGMTNTSSGTMTALPAAEEEGRKKWPWVVLGVVLLVLAVLAAVFIPRLMDNEPDTVTVPDVTGLSERAAKREIRQTEGIVLGDVERQNSTEVPAGEVISQNPEGGEAVPLETTVDLVVSAGPADVVVPNLFGLTEDQARAAVDGAGLQIDVRRETNDADAGTVFRSEPEAGTQVEFDSEVVVYVSTGPNELPDVTGRTEEDAKRILKDARFEPGEVAYDSSEGSEDEIGTVLRQSPKGGEPTRSDQQIAIVVANYQPPEPDPEPEPTDDPPDLPTDPTTPPEDDGEG